MNVLLINGSPHAKGCTYMALHEVETVLNQEGIDTEIVHVGNKNIRGCIACFQCVKQHQCVIDDFVNEVTPKFRACDGIVVGSPVYFASANGTLISFLDRLFAGSAFYDLSMKVGASVVSARRGGCSATFDELNKYFTMRNMPVVSSQYWNQVHGHSPEDVKKDEEGLQIMRTLGRNMAFLIKSIDLGKKEFGLPEKEEPISTNFIR